MLSWVKNLLGGFNFTIINYIIVIGAILAYSYGLYHYGYSTGQKIESINTLTEKNNRLSMQNKYNQDAIVYQNQQVKILQDNINALIKASDQFAVAQAKVNTITKEIHTQTVKEIQNPVYSECKVSTDYFNLINNTVDKLNSSGK